MSYNTAIGWTRCLEKIGGYNRTDLTAVLTFYKDANTSDDLSALLSRLDITETVNDSKATTFGTACSNKAEIKLLNVTPTQLVNIVDGGKVVISMNVYWGFYSKNLGTFYIDSIKSADRQNGNYNIDIVAYDGFCKTEKKYVTTIASLPTTPRAIVTDIANQCGLTLNTNSWSNTISIGSIKSDLTFRQTIGYMAALQGGFARFNRDGNLECAWYTTTAKVISQSQQYLDGFTLDNNDNIVIKLIETGTSDNPIVYPNAVVGRSIKFENPYIDSTMAASIYTDRVANDAISFMPLTVKWIGNPEIQAGDIVAVTDKNGTNQTCYIMSKKMSFDGGLYETYYCYGQSETSVSFSPKSPTDQKLARQYTALEEAIKTATEAITGVTGGCVKLVDLDGDGYPDNIFAAGTNFTEADISPTGKIAGYNGNIVRVNSAGWGLSSDGGTTYVTAATGAGINANAITTGLLNAARIAAGSINTEKLAAGAVTSEKVASGSITTDKLSVGTGEAQNRFFNDELEEDYGWTVQGASGVHMSSGGSGYYYIPVSSTSAAQILYDAELTTSPYSLPSSPIENRWYYSGCTLTRVVSPAHYSNCKANSSTGLAKIVQKKSGLVYGKKYTISAQVYLNISALSSANNLKIGVCIGSRVISYDAQKMFANKSIIDEHHMYFTFVHTGSPTEEVGICWSGFTEGVNVAWISMKEENALVSAVRRDSVTSWADAHVAYRGSAAESIAITNNAETAFVQKAYLESEKRYGIAMQFYPLDSSWNLDNGPSIGICVDGQNVPLANTVNLTKTSTGETTMYFIFDYSGGSGFKQVGVWWNGMLYSSTQKCAVNIAWMALREITDETALGTYCSRTAWLVNANQKINFSQNASNFLSEKGLSVGADGFLQSFGQADFSVGNIGSLSFDKNGIYADYSHQYFLDASTPESGEGTFLQRIKIFVPPQVVDFERQSSGSNLVEIFECVSCGNRFETVDEDNEEYTGLYTSRGISISDKNNTTYILPASTTSAAFNVSSREKIKKNISEKASVLSKIKKAKIYEYDLKGGKDGAKRKTGFVVERETPEEVISDDGNGINLYSMAAMNWKATQEILERIEALEGSENNGNS